MTRRRHDPNSWTVVRLPERDLGDVVLELVAPLIERLGPVDSTEDARRAIELAVTFWNASVLASQSWEFPQVKELNQLKKRMRGRQASRDDAATFDLLAERFREHWLDPRLVEDWTYDADETGARRLVCTMGLPDGVKAEAPPPIEKRISIGGKFLDEVRISLGSNTSLIFPVDRHRSAIGEDGIVTVYAAMPAALQLFAEGRLPAVGGAAVELAIGSRKPGAMVLAELRCGGEDHRHDIAVLVFRPAHAKVST